MRSIVVGSMSSMREIDDPPELEPDELMRMPSTNTIGSFDCVSEAFPRMWMRMPSPARPEVAIAWTPGSRPCSSSEALLIGANLGGSIVATELPSRLTSVAPAVPVVTTACSEIADCESEKSTVTVWPAATVSVFEPGE